MSVTLEVQQLATQLIEQGLMSQSEASKSIKLTATEPQKRLSCTSIKHASWTSTNPCSTCTHVVQDSKRIKSTKSKKPAEGIPYPQSSEYRWNWSYHTMVPTSARPIERIWATHKGRLWYDGWIPTGWWYKTMMKMNKRKMNGSMLK